MKNRYSRPLAAMGVVGLAMTGGSHSAFAQSAGNPDFQTFFGLSVCTGNFVASRCSETFDSTPNAAANEKTLADISPNSQSSLNPNQVTVNAMNALSAAQALADETEKRIENLRDSEGGKSSARNDTVATFGRLNLFANVQGEWATKNLPAYQVERGFKGTRYKGTLGLDLGLSGGGRIGVLGSYDDYELTFDAELPGPSFAPQANAGSSKSRTGTVAAFAMFPIGGSGWVDAAAGVGWSSNDFNRRAIFVPRVLASGKNTTLLAQKLDAYGHASGTQLFASLGAGFDVNSGASSFGPYARLRYTRTSIDAYRETDRNATDLEMAISRQVAKSFVGILGARASHSISAKWGVVVPQLRVEYEHEFESDPVTTRAYYVQDLDKYELTLSSNRPDQDHFNLGASLVFVLPHGVMPFVDYEALLGYSNFTRHRVTVGFRVEL